MQVPPLAGEIRILLISDGSRIGSRLAGELACHFKLEVRPFTGLADDQGAQLPCFDGLILDTGSLPRQTRGVVVRQMLGRLRRVPGIPDVITLVASRDERTTAVAAASGIGEAATPTDACGLVHRLRAAAALHRLRGDGDARPGPEIQRQMVGTSKAMRRVFSLIRQVSPVDVPVLLTGESGTGKELAALAIHERSLRAGGPFAPINCAAIPEQLLESELFGYERGAFTGAHRTRPGRVEAAHGGTLFLDEIGDLAPTLQAKLLRFLEDREVEHIGGSGRFFVDARVIAATNADLGQAVEEGRFRSDLYYRLAVFPIHLPPLRSRAEDVLLMARLFLRRYAAESGRDLRGFSIDGIDALWKASWPGNVRELINRVRRAVVVADGPLVTAGDLDLAVPVEAPPPTLAEALARCEIETVQAALKRAGGNRSEAARMLAISRSTFYELLHRHHVG